MADDELFPPYYIYDTRGCLKELSPVHVVRDYDYAYNKNIGLNYEDHTLGNGLKNLALRGWFDAFDAYAYLHNHGLKSRSVVVLSTETAAEGKPNRYLWCIRIEISDRNTSNLPWGRRILWPVPYPRAMHAWGVYSQDELLSQSRLATEFTPSKFVSPDDFLLAPLRQRPHRALLLTIATYSPPQVPWLAIYHRDGSDHIPLGKGMKIYHRDRGDHMPLGPGIQPFSMPEHTKEDMEKYHALDLQRKRRRRRGRGVALFDLPDDITLGCIIGRLMNECMQTCAHDRWARNTIAVLNLVNFRMRSLMTMMMRATYQRRINLSMHLLEGKLMCSAARNVFANFKGTGVTIHYYLMHTQEVRKNLKEEGKGYTNVDVCSAIMGARKFASRHCPEGPIAHFIRSMPPISMLAPAKPARNCRMLED